LEPRHERREEFKEFKGFKEFELVAKRGKAVVHDQGRPWKHIPGSE
jgi:hypothetical protein